VVAAERVAVRPEVRRALAVLRAGLEHRFGTDLELGTGPSTAEHDIWLSRPDGAA
jgi:hypothetical protein